MAVDKDGDIYIIETKLYKNSDKRTVVAQALDYGSALWRHLNDFDEFVQTLNQETQKNFSLDFQEKIEEFFELDNEQSEFTLSTMRQNLKDGNLKFVILMDSIDERLKDLIVYVNQNSQFDIYAVQLEYYKFNNYEIIIPKIFGVEVKKNIKSSGVKREWTKEEFLRDVKEKSGEKNFEIINDLLEFSQKNADKVRYGKGKDGVFLYKIKTSQGDRTVFSVYSNGETWLIPKLRLKKGVDNNLVDELIEQLKKIKNIKVSTYVEVGEKYDDFDFSKLGKDEMTEFKKIIKNFTEKFHQM